jgi:1,2-dihydroxy-3-keto-5-methylthiopentene dioxygenase
MSLLVVMPEESPRRVLVRTEEETKIRDLLGPHGVTFERWRADAELAPGAAQAEVLAAYRRDVDRLRAHGGYTSEDVVRLHPDVNDPQGFAQKARAARAGFRAEHLHADDEVRFFVEGSGLFYLRIEGKVHCLRCTRHDLLRVPAHTRHWFDMGAVPSFCAIRLFTRPDGWVASFTGDEIAERFPSFDEIGEVEAEPDAGERARA